MGAPIQSQTAPPSSPAPSGGGDCGHGGGQMAPAPMAQASQPPQQSSMPSWFTGNSGGTPAISQPSIGGPVNGGGLIMQAPVLDENKMGNGGAATGRPLPASWMDKIKGGSLPMQSGVSGMPPLDTQSGSVGQSMDMLSLPWNGGGGMMMGPDGQAKAGIGGIGQVMPQTLFSM